jgi:transcriptional regulator with XRE-family HTH domain
MVIKAIERWLEPKGSTPNRFTLRMGEKIREAREEKGYSQSKLAHLIYRRQASLSDMENGKMQPDAETLLYLSLQLDKPVSYFYPDDLSEFIEPKELNPLEQELLIQARKLGDDDLKRLIAQTKALASLIDTEF